MAWQNQPKINFLPIQKTDFGYCQKANYVQPDLYHEEVIEIDSPFAEIISSDTKIFTFLLLGDQNAGKSTLIHSFCYHADENFLDLTVILPILKASFLNSRFLIENKSPMDEIPFLDTDIARGGFLLTRESFSFWLMENELKLSEELSEDIAYVLIQFIEIGGDHLDRMMGKHLQSNDLHLSSIIEKSVSIVKSAKKSIYFVNMSTFLIQIDGDYHVNPNAFRLFKERIEYLDHLFNEEHSIMVYLSRIPDTLKIVIGDKIISTPEQLREYFLSIFPIGKSIVLADVIPSNHLNPNGSVNYDNVLSTLSLLFSRDHIHQSSKEFFSITVSSLLTAWKYLLPTNQDIPFVLSRDEFKEFLDSVNVGTFEIPESLLLQNYYKTFCQLLHIPLCIPVVHNFSPIRLSFSDVNLKLISWCSNSYRLTQEQDKIPQSLVNFRFPYSTSLFNVITSIFEINAPNQFWLKDNGTLLLSSDHTKLLSQITEELTSKIQNQWKNIVRTSSKSFSSYWEKFVDDLEEWVIVAQLLKKPVPQIVLDLPSPDQWNIFHNHLKALEDHFVEVFCENCTEKLLLSCTTEWEKCC